MPEGLSRGDNFKAERFYSQHEFKSDREAKYEKEAALVDDLLAELSPEQVQKYSSIIEPAKRRANDSMWEMRNARETNLKEARAHKNSLKTEYIAQAKLDAEGAGHEVVLAPETQALVDEHFAKQVIEDGEGDQGSVDKL